MCQTNRKKSNKQKSRKKETENSLRKPEKTCWSIKLKIMEEVQADNCVYVTRILYQAFNCESKQNCEATLNKKT
jgi:hypothetical protein